MKLSTNFTKEGENMDTNDNCLSYDKYAGGYDADGYYQYDDMEVCDVPQD